MLLHTCPFCGSSDIGIINVLDIVYSVGCRNCGMTGPQEPTQREAEESWAQLCAKMCTKCVHKHYGRALLARAKEVRSRHVKDENCSGTDEFGANDRGRSDNG